MSSIIEQVLQNLPLRKPVDKLISSSRAGTELRGVIQKFRPFVDDVQAAIEDLNERVTDATSTTINMDLASLELPPDIQSEVHLHVQNLTLGSPNSGDEEHPQAPTEYWNDYDNLVQFFVDTTGGGSDTNDGLSELTPFATLDKALDLLKTKKLSYNWNTYLRIKGAVQAPLNFDGIYTHAEHFIYGPMLWLTGWNGERWTLDVTAGDEVNGAGSAIIDNSQKITTSIESADILIEKSLLIEKASVEFNGVKFIPGANSYRYCLWAMDANVIFKGFTSNPIIWDLTNVSSARSILATGNDCLVELRGDHFWENGDYVNNAFVFVERGAIADFTNYYGQGLPKQVDYDSISTVKLPPNNTLYLQGFNGGNLISGYDDHRQTATTLHFQTLENGRYMLAYSPNQGRLLEWKLSAEAGTGTFLIDANGTALAPSVSQGFVNFEQVAGQTLNFSSPWTNAYRFFLNVSGANNLTNVTIQLLWEPHTAIPFNN